MQKKGFQISANMIIHMFMNMNIGKSVIELSYCQYYLLQQTMHHLVVAAKGARQVLWLLYYKYWSL